MTEKEQQPESLTLEAIERDPWNAVRLDIPNDATAALVAKIGKTAREFEAVLQAARAEANSAAHWATAEGLAEVENVAHVRAGQTDRLSDYLESLDAPSVDCLDDFTGRTIEALTKAPDTRLLPPDGRMAAYIHNARVDLGYWKPEQQPDTGLLVDFVETPSLDAINEQIEAARNREGQNMPGIMSLDAIRANPWVAVHAAVPPKPSLELLSVAYTAAEQCEAQGWQAVNRARAGETFVAAEQGDTPDNEYLPPHEYFDDDAFKAGERKDMLAELQRGNRPDALLPPDIVAEVDAAEARQHSNRFSRSY